MSQIYQKITLLFLCFSFVSLAEKGCHSDCYSCYEYSKDGNDKNVFHVSKVYI